MAADCEEPTVLRQKIMEAARYLFGQQGFDHTTLQDITERLNLCESVFAMHFVSKDDLLEAVWSE